MLVADSTELNPEVQAVITLLSTGPVGVGDRIGLSNVSLIHRSVSSEPCGQLHCHLWSYCNDGTGGFVTALSYD